MEMSAPFAVTNNSDRAIINNDVGLQDILLSELCAHQLFPHPNKKGLEHAVGLPAF